MFCLLEETRLLLHAIVWVIGKCYDLLQQLYWHCASWWDLPRGTAAIFFRNVKVFQRLHWRLIWRGHSCELRPHLRAVGRNSGLWIHPRHIHGSSEKRSFSTNQRQWNKSKDSISISRLDPWSVRHIVWFFTFAAAKHESKNDPPPPPPHPPSTAGDKSVIGKEKAKKGGNKNEIFIDIYERINVTFNASVSFVGVPAAHGQRTLVTWHDWDTK